MANQPARSCAEPQPGATRSRGLGWVKLACQAGFVISFYDLSKTREQGHRPALHGYIPTGSSPPGEQHIDKTDGAAPTAFRAAPTEKIRECRGRKFW
jgi:hypothetical protein